MKKTTLLPWIALLLLGMLACGSVSSGTWTDDPDNWERAFQSQKPEDVVVLHSQYWRSPHFTYEFLYFFAIEANEHLEQQLLTENDLVQIEDANTQDVAQAFLDAPDWFAAKPLENYEVYRSHDHENSNLFIFVDIESRDIYVTDSQY